MAKNLSGPGKKLHGWANGSREPAQCGAQYGVWENEKEYGTFTVERNGKSEEIEGHMMWKNKASVTLIWELPGSTAAAVDTFERDEWKKDWKSDGEIEYDDHEGFESSEGKGSEAFEDAGNTIDDYDDFEGRGSTDVVAFGSRGAPWNIWITYDNGQTIFFEDDEDSWTVKIADGEPESIPDYGAVLELVRICLNREIVTNV